MMIIDHLQNKVSEADQVRFMEQLGSSRDSQQGAVGKAGALGHPDLGSFPHHLGGLEQGTFLMCKMGVTILLTSRDFILVLVNIHDPVGDEMMNKRRIRACVLSQRTENTVREAEVHELLQNKWDNDQG